MLVAALAAGPGAVAPAATRPRSVPPWRSHTALLDAGAPASHELAAHSGALGTLARAIDLAIVASPERARAFAGAGIPVALALDVNRCAGSRGAAAFGYEDAIGADAGAEPDCSNRARWTDDAFYHVGSDVLFEPTGGGGPFGALGNPARAAFRSAAVSAMRGALGAAAPLSSAAPAAFFLRDVASPDEIGAACVASETPKLPFSCTDTDDVSSADGAADWLQGETQLIHGAPRPVYLDGLAAYDTDPAGTHHAAAEIAHLAREANVAGAACDDCFYAGDFTRLGYQVRSAMAFVAAGKRVIAIDEGPRGAPRFAPTPPRSRTTALAAIALFYDYDLTYLASRSCGTVSGIAVCPEATLVFREPAATVTNPERLRDASGAYRRAFGSCAIGGVDYGPCLALVNAKPYAVIERDLPVALAAPDPAVSDVAARASAPGPVAGTSAYPYSLVAKGYALPTGYGDAPGTLAFHPLGAADTDAATERLHLPAESGTILFRSAMPAPQP